MEIKYKIWIEKDGRVLFGHGRDDILQTIDGERSLNAAAKKLGMSYRAAWGRLRASEERLGIKLVGTGKGKIPGADRTGPGDHRAFRKA